MKFVSIRHLLCCLAGALGAAVGAWAQTPPPSALQPQTFAVLSLVGDQFSVVFRREESGTRLDPNSRREYPMPAATFDDIAVGAVEDALKRLKPVAPVLRFSIRDARLFALQDKLLVESAESHDVRVALAKLLRDNTATRLVLVTKWRDDARFQVVDGRIGLGKISGLGFFVDSHTRMQQNATGEETNGFLGPYAYLSVTVADAATLQPIRSAQGRESEMTLPLHATGALRAWDALTPEGKIDAMERVLRRAVDSAATAALAD